MKQKVPWFIWCYLVGGYGCFISAIHFEFLGDYHAAAMDFLVGAFAFWRLHRYFAKA